MTTFHCDKLCGCDTCAPTRWALRVQSLVDRGLPAMIAGMSDAQSAALYDVSDPAKLAELMASALRARGAEVEPHRFVDLGDVIGLRMRINGKPVRVTVPQARAKLLAIMQTTADESSRNACERILRGDNGAPFALDAWPNEDER